MSGEGGGGEGGGARPDRGAGWTPEAEPEGLIPRDGRIGRYTVLAELGSGGMGVVYKAWDPVLDRPVALKVMIAGRFALRRHVARFLDEARAIARLDHPALISIYDMGLVDEYPFFTMECVDGQSLEAVIAADGPLDAHRAARIAAAVAHGLDHAHRQGVVHRDIKPANVLVDGDDAPRVIDFGLARLLESTDDDRTRPGQVLGTPAYMAPEQAEGRSAAIGPRTDVYSLGALLAYAVTGRRPRPASDHGLGSDHPADRMAPADRPPSDRMTRDSRPDNRPGPASTELPRDLLAICHRACALAPEDRYPTAAAMAADLDRFLRGEPVEASLPGPLRRAGWWLHRARGTFLRAALAALVGLAIVSAVQHARDTRRARAAAERAERREAAAVIRLAQTLAEARALRAADRAAEADALETAAALRIDVQATRALARFHLARARALTRADEPALALAATATAYAVAEADPERLEALTTLGHRFIDARDAPALAAVVATLAHRFPTHRAERAPLELHALIFEGRLLEAAEHAAADYAPADPADPADPAAHPAAPTPPEPDWAPLLRALAVATETPHRLPTIGPSGSVLVAPWIADVTGDGHPELWTGDTLLATTDATLPILPFPPLPPTPQSTPSLPAPALPPGDPIYYRPIDGLPGAFTTRHDTGHATIIRHDGHHWRTLGTLPPLDSEAIIAGDLDQDGHPEIYQSPTRKLRALIPGPTPTDPWTETIAHPPSEAAALHTGPLRIIHLGHPLLLAGTQGWQAYDLRLYQARAPGHLDLIARRQTGTLYDALLLPGDPPHIAIAVATPETDAHLFPPETPRGLPPGIHLATYDPTTGITWRHHIPDATGEDHTHRLFAGDIDGDDLTDLATLTITRANHFHTNIHRRLPHGWARPLPLLGFQPLALIDVDADGDTELIAHHDATDRTWVLGTGTTPAPRRPHPPLPPTTTTGRTAALEDLVALGRLPEALQGWQREIMLGNDPPAAAARAAQIAERLGRFEEAAALHLRAADDPTRALTALRAAADNNRAARRPHAEIEALTRLATTPHLTPTERTLITDRLAALATEITTRITLDLRAPLDPRWQITTPDRLHLDRHAATLTLTADPIGEIARLPLIRTRERIALEVQMQTPRIEYGAGITLALVATTTTGAEVDLAHITNCGWGGGSVIYQRIFAALPDTGHAVLHNRRLTTTAGQPLHVHIEHDRSTATTLLIDRATGHRERRPRPFNHPTEILTDHLALVIRYGDHDTGQAPQIKARITALTLDGARLAPPADNPHHAAARALAQDQPDAALQALEHLPPTEATTPTTTALRAAALYDRGDWPQADALIRHHLTAAPATQTTPTRTTPTHDDPIDRFLRGRLRTAPLHHAPHIRTTLGPAADPLIWRTFAPLFDKHRADPPTRIAANAALLGAETDDPTTTPHPLIRAHLWLTRARIRRETGELGGALADLHHCEQTLAAHAPTDPDHAHLATDAHLERAALEANHDPAAAQAAIRAALTRSPAPEITADRILADPDLRPLHHHPIWPQVKAAAAW